MTLRLVKITRKWLLLLCVLAMTGCTFYFLDGNGPQERGKCAGYLTNATARDIERWKEQASPSGKTRRSSFPYVRSNGSRSHSTGPRNGYTEYWGSTQYPFALLSLIGGPLRERSLFEPSEGQGAVKRQIVDRSDSFFILMLLNCVHESAAYDYPSGQCVYWGRYTWIGGGIVCFFGRDVGPPGRRGAGAVSPEWTDLSTDLESLRYNNESAFCIGLGALAWGQKNGRVYVQIAWIPIPLWTTGQERRSGTQDVGEPPSLSP